MNIQAVAALIESRSKFVNHSSDSEAQHSLTAVTGTLDTLLPDLPLLDLKKSRRRYVECRKVLQTPEETQKLLSVVENFRDKDGSGHKLQDRLLAEQKSEHGLWQWDLYSKDIYLSRRDPLHPYVTFYGGHIVSDDILHSRVERTAISTHAACCFKMQVENRTLGRNTLNEGPLCTQTLPWLFNSCREPNLGVNKRRRYPGHGHIVVLRRGHVFKLEPRKQKR